MFWRYKWKFRNSTEIRALDSLLPTASNVCAILVIVNVSSVYRYWSFMSLQAATRSDSMTLTPGPWLGLPAVTAVTLYRHEDPALVGWHHFQRNWKSAYCDHFCDIFWWSSGVLGIMFVQLPHCSASLYCVSQSLAAGLTSSHPVEKLRALPLWLSLQYLGHNGIVQKIKHATTLVRITNIGNMSRICT